MNSFKILAVDDESHAIEVIAHLLKKMEGFDIDIYRARSYDEAMRVLTEWRMDLVITDIEMPEKSGLELVAQVKKLWRQCRIIGRRSIFAYNKGQFVKICLVDTCFFQCYNEVIEASISAVQDFMTLVQFPI